MEIRTQRTIRPSSCSATSSSLPAKASWSQSSPSPESCSPSSTQSCETKPDGSQESLDRKDGRSSLHLKSASKKNKLEEASQNFPADRGAVLKVNQSLRYATNAANAGVFALACEQAGVPLQRYEHRAELPCVWT